MKKILYPMCMRYKKIYVCSNDCIYMNEFNVKDGDFSCDDEITKGIFAKVLWYLLIISRFKRLFANANDAKNVRWHEDERKCNG